MQNPQQLGNASNEAVKYQSGRFSTIPVSLIKFLVLVKVGRNAMAVIMTLCRHVRPDGSFAKLSRAKMAAETTLTHEQIARGMAELKQKLVIEPISFVSADGTIKQDRSNFRHVATYRFTKEAWNYIQRDIT